MTEKSSLLKYQELALKAISNISNSRSQDILISRFGLKDGKRRTLEEIGKKYNITRERVRQIEEAAFSDLRKPSLLLYFQPGFNELNSFLNREGRLAREERLFLSLTGVDKPHQLWGTLFFILTLGKPYQRHIESNRFYSFWSNSTNALERLDNFVVQLVNSLKEKDETVPLDFVYQLSRSKGINLSKRALYSYLDASKEVYQNCFGQFGLVGWPEINPRGAKDKAYVVLKNHRKPLHFKEIADLINKAKLGNIKAKAQTVHNELIKDKRFVLVGRGTYGLKEWGYRTGTVKDVIYQILKEKGPLSKEEILEAVSSDRLVKKNTVLINLQNKEYFKKNKEGKYGLIEGEQA